MLIDTGGSKENRRHQLRSLNFQWLVNKADLPAGQAIDEQLADWVILSQDINYVLMSYLHCDHADGLHQVHAAKHLLVSEEE